MFHHDALLYSSSYLLKSFCNFCLLSMFVSSVLLKDIIKFWLTDVWFWHVTQIATLSVTCFLKTAEWFTGHPNQNMTDKWAFSGVPIETSHQTPQCFHQWLILGFVVAVLMWSGRMCEIPELWMLSVFSIDETQYIQLLRCNLINFQSMKS